MLKLAGLGRTWPCGMVREPGVWDPFIESQNHRTASVGKDLKDHLASGINTKMNKVKW